MNYNIDSFFTLFTISFLWWQFLSGFAVSAGLHRYFSHASFKAPSWYEYVVLFLAPLSGSGSVLGWVGVHRMHHAFSDTDKDPHSPRHIGLWRVALSSFKVPSIPRKFVSDLLKNKKVLWFHKNHKIIRMTTFAMGFLFLPFGYFLAFIVAPFFYGHLGFGLLNTLCHRGGHVQNSWIVNIFTGGDGWHANHHTFPGSYKIGLRWWQIDLGVFFIHLISFSRKW